MIFNAPANLKNVKSMTYQFSNANYAEFYRFVNEKYSVRPYDFDDNPYGFGRVPHIDLSDISAHLPFLEFLARECNHITEFGTRECFSTAAFLYGIQMDGTLISYDLVKTNTACYLETLQKPCNWIFRVADTGNLNIEQTDMLFVDTLHTYEHVSKELSQHNLKMTNKYLVFHDTYSQGIVSLDVPGEKGILSAIWDAINIYNEDESNADEWKCVYASNFNHGLLVYEKVSRTTFLHVVRQLWNKENTNDEQ